MKNPFQKFSQRGFEAAVTNESSRALLPNCYDWAIFLQLDVIQE
jgi:hypothetical protein